MRFLLTSAGIKNASIRDALVDLLGKPIAESSALCIPTAGYGHPQGTPAGARARGRVLPSCVRSCFRARRSGPRLRLRPCGRIRSASGDRARRERALTVVAAVAPHAMAAAFLLAQLFSGNP